MVRVKTLKKFVKIFKCTRCGYESDSEHTDSSLEYDHIDINTAHPDDVYPEWVFKCCVCGCRAKEIK